MRAVSLLLQRERARGVFHHRKQPIDKVRFLADLLKQKLGALLFMVRLVLIHACVYVCMYVCVVCVWVCILFVSERFCDKVRFLAIYKYMCVCARACVLFDVEGYKITQE